MQVPRLGWFCTLGHVVSSGLVAGVLGLIVYLLCCLLLCLAFACMDLFLEWLGSQGYSPRPLVLEFFIEWLCYPQLTGC